MMLRIQYVLFLKCRGSDVMVDLENFGSIMLKVIEKKIFSVFSLYHAVCEPVRIRPVKRVLQIEQSNLCEHENWR